jgi:antitoxin component YwqK of YwqJK toxin-antitoxin module
MTYKLGIMNGLTETFYEGWSLYLKGNSKNGKRDGIWITYKPDGTIESEQPFKDGVAIN